MVIIPFAFLDLLPSLGTVVCHGEHSRTYMWIRVV